MLLWCASLAFADDPPTDPIDIPPAEPVPSAIDDDPEAEGTMEGMIRSKPFVRPVLGVAAHEGQVAVRLGGAVGQTWWTLGDRRVRVGGETALRATAPLGGASGYRLDLGTRAGPWLGRVNVSVGPTLRLDRELWGGDRLDTGLLLGGTLDLGLDVGAIGLLAGVAPYAGLAGDRGRAPSDLLPALGAETDWRLGIRGTLGVAELTGELVDRETGVGSVVEVAVGLRVRLP